MSDIERYSAPDEAKTVGAEAETLGRLAKLEALEQVLAVRLSECSVRETAGISRELRDCWREIEELRRDSARSEPEDDELAARRLRVDAARAAAAKAGASS